MQSKRDDDDDAVIGYMQFQQNFDTRNSIRLGRMHLSAVFLTGLRRQLTTFVLKHTSTNVFHPPAVMPCFVQLLQQRKPTSDLILATGER